ncbi:MAG: hypothetical protein RL632_1554 [Bacteroidota bacterium]|jgi:hypothetical protein
MILAADVHFKCDDCGAIHSRGSLASGNTFGAVLYSDAKTIYPHLPEFSAITTCKRCAKIFWLDNHTKYILTGHENEQIFASSFLSVSDYTNAFKDKVYRTESEEHFLRVRMLWEFHDPFRSDEKDVSTLRKIPEYVENLERLISLCSDAATPPERLMIAEFYRYLGRHAQANDIIEPLLGSEVDDFAKTLMRRNKLADSAVLVMSTY